MSFPASQKKACRKRGWRSRFRLSAAGMDVSRAVWPPLVLNQLENAGVDCCQGVAQWAPQPARKGGNRNTNRGRCGIAALVIRGNRRQEQGLHLRAETILDGPEQPLLVDLNAMAGVPVIEAHDQR